jgi:hypothetical protein
MLRCLLLAGLLAAIPTAAGAYTNPTVVSYPWAKSMFTTSQGISKDAMVAVTLVIESDPYGYTINTRTGPHKFCHKYTYEVELWDEAGYPDDFIGGLKINTGGTLFVAQPPTQVEDFDNSNNGNPAAWSVNTFSAGVSQIQYQTYAAGLNGIHHMAHFFFPLYTDAEPVKGDLCFTGLHCTTGNSCLTATVTIPYKVPGSQCCQGTQPTPTPTPTPIPSPVVSCSHAFNLAQVYPASPGSLPGYPGPGCFMGESVTPFTSAVVPGVLSLAKNGGYHLDVQRFANGGCCAFPVVQFVTLTQTMPGSVFCPDIYPTRTITQTGDGIRTWWPLQFTQPGTTFRLRLQGSCGSAPYQEEYLWTVVANPESLALLLDLFHTAEIGKTEVPCILGEDTYVQLKACYTTLSQRINALKAAPGDGNRRIAAVSAVLDCQALINLYAMFVESVADVGLFVSLPSGNLAPTVANPPPGIPNIAGIIDTIESPCGCKMLVDLEYIARANGLVNG